MAGPWGRYAAESPFFKAEYYSIAWLGHLLFDYSSVDGLVDAFHLLATVNTAALNMGVWILVCILHFLLTFEFFLLFPFCLSHHLSYSFQLPVMVLSFSQAHRILPPLLLSSSSATDFSTRLPWYLLVVCPHTPVFCFWGILPPRSVLGCCPGISRFLSGCSVFLCVGNWKRLKN